MHCTYINCKKKSDHSGLLYYKSALIAIRITKGEHSRSLASESLGNFEPIPSCRNFQIGGSYDGARGGSEGGGEWLITTCREYVSHVYNRGMIHIILGRPAGKNCYTIETDKRGWLIKLTCVSGRDIVEYVVCSTLREGFGGRGGFCRTTALHCIAYHWLEPQGKLGGALALILILAEGPLRPAHQKQNTVLCGFMPYLPTPQNQIVPKKPIVVARLYPPSTRRGGGSSCFSSLGSAFGARFTPTSRVGASGRFRSYPGQ